MSNRYQEPEIFLQTSLVRAKGLEGQQCQWDGVLAYFGKASGKPGATFAGGGVPPGCGGTGISPAQGWVPGRRLGAPRSG
jgi:hypothetical protein